MIYVHVIYIIQYWTSVDLLWRNLQNRLSIYFENRSRKTAIAQAPRPHVLFCVQYLPFLK